LGKIGIVGSGFAGLSAACILAKYGHDVTIYEKNSAIGGRARAFETDGFTFDMGPSWYWMPDVFERFFNLFDKTTSDFYQLTRLDPSYQVIFSDGDIMKVPASYDEFEAMFEQYEPGSAAKLRKFLSSAHYKYEVGLGEYVHKPSLSIAEFIDPKILTSFMKMSMFSSISKEVRSLFKNPKLIELLEFPVLFLGAKPSDTPALYSLMNYADIKLGTWYPMGGMSMVPKAMAQIAESQGVDIRLDHAVTGFEYNNRSISGITSSKGSHSVDTVVSGADYHHTETSLLLPEHRSYDDCYWDKRVMAPSSLIFYLGCNQKYDKFEHHNLFFDTDFGKHAAEIYDHPQWPTQPLFYVCAPSTTDDSIAPSGCENLFILIPLAAGLEDDMFKREELFELVCNRIKARLNIDLTNDIIYKRSFCLDDFKSEYNSFKGNAYGLSNTLLQTAFLKPKMKSKKINNLYYAGQLTTPGPGVPPSLISGEVVANYINNRHK
jgi:phytoene desaturase